MKSINNSWRGANIGFATSVSMFAICVSAPAFAQDKNAQASAQTDEIVVTAQFHSQKLQDTPIAITAVTGASLEARSATSLSDAAGNAPSVVLRPASAAFGDSVTASIRGLGQGDFNPALEPGVGIYIDDVYFPRLTGANFDLMDVDRVEVLRGPQGTLTGKNSEGGAIKFFSKMPTGESGGYLSATYGSRHRVNLRGSVDFKLAEDLYGRVSGAYGDQDGYVNVYDFGCKNPSSGQPSRGNGTDCLVYKEGDVGYKALRGILRYNPSDRLDVTINGDYTKSSHHNAGQVLLYASNSNPNVRTSAGLPFDNRFICGQFCNYDTFSQTAGTWTAGIIPALQGLPVAATQGSELMTYSGWGVAGNIALTLSDNIKVTSITAYRSSQNDFGADNDLSPANIGFGWNHVTSKNFSQELRLNVDMGDMVKTTVGGYISDERSNYNGFQDIRYVAVPTPGGPLPIYPLQFYAKNPYTTKSQAVFGNVELKASENFTINAGLRYTHDSKATTFYRYALDGVTPNPFLPINNVQGKFAKSRADYRVALDYRFSPEVMGYASVATGYKAGGIGPRPFNAAQVQGFGPENVTNYEVGVKTDLLDRKVRLNLDVFYLDFKNAQLTLLACPQFGGPGPCALPQNAGNAHSKGVEAELSIRPVEGFMIDGTLSYQDWKWTCVNPAVVGLASGACSSDRAVISLINSRPPSMMKWKWSAGAQYEIDLGDTGSLTPRFDIAYQGDMIGNVLAPVAGSPSAIFGQMPSNTLANARITWRNPNKDLEVAFEVTNVFDKYYYTSKFDLNGAGAGLISGTPGRPREWAVSIKKKF